MHDATPVPALVPHEHTFAYSTFRGSGESHRATLRLPHDVVGAPLVLNVHGGFWKTRWSLQTLSAGKLLAAFPGCATLDVEYARVNQDDPAASHEGGGFPHSCLDVLAALNSLVRPGLVPADLRARLDLSRIYLCGHSAGGQIALWIALLSRLSEAQRDEYAATLAAVAGPAAAQALRQGVSPELGLRGVIGLAPLACLADALADGLSDHHDAVVNFLWRAGEAPRGGSLYCTGLQPLLHRAAASVALGCRSQRRARRAMRQRGVPVRALRGTVHRHTGRTTTARAARLQPHASPTPPGCSPTPAPRIQAAAPHLQAAAPRLQAAAPRIQAAAPCHPGCSPMSPRLQPHVTQARAACLRRR